MKMEEEVGMIAHNNAYFNTDGTDQDDLYQEDLAKNETIEHTMDNTREPSQRKGRDSKMIYDGSAELILNPGSATSSVEAKQWANIGPPDIEG